jgi:uncharacterized protein (TIGR02453 family)
MTYIQKSTFVFLKNLARNNDREWFNRHKDEYHMALENTEAFVDALILKMNTHDHIETPSGKKSLYRIYNDVRFAKDKTPYNPRFAGYLKRAKPLLRGGYYFWIRPGGSRIGCGFTYPNADDLKRMRLDIFENYKDWRRILQAGKLRRDFGPMQGSQVATAPKGFQKDHPAIDLLRYKQYWFEHAFTDKEVLSKDFVLQVNKIYKTIRPFFDYATDVLNTDLNGESVR